MKMDSGQGLKQSPFIARSRRCGERGRVGLGKETWTVKLPWGMAPSFLPSGLEERLLFFLINDADYTGVSRCVTDVASLRTSGGQRALFYAGFVEALRSGVESFYSQEVEVLGSGSVLWKTGATSFPRVSKARAGYRVPDRWFRQHLLP